MHQTAPYPDTLADLVGRLSYRESEGWRVWLDDDLQRDKPGRHAGESRGMTLVVQRCGPDSYNPDSTIAVNHYFPVPPATYNARSWQWWLFEQIGLVELHERCEMFLIDGKPAYPPAHGPGNSPYLVMHYGTDEDRRTLFTGEMAEA
jgi:hypothetical protein